MNFARAVLFTVTVAFFSHTSPTTNIYHQELEDFKKTPDYTFIFDEEAEPVLRGIHRDVKNYTHLTKLQMLARIAFEQALVVTPSNLPKLYTYIDGLCKKANIQTPVIFVNIDKGLFNAAAYKLLTSSGAIVIGQELMRKSSDTALEAVIAHEIGHIKHNHVNKIIAINLTSLIVTATTMYNLGIRVNFTRLHSYINTYLTIVLYGQTANLISSSIVNKKFEKEADEFAYNAMQKGEGLKEFFKTLEEKDAKKEQEFLDTKALLEKNMSNPAIGDLCGRYYMAYWGRKAFRWLYYNTPFGPHPSTKKRIKTVDNYLDKQATNTAAPTATPTI